MEGYGEYQDGIEILDSSMPSTLVQQERSYVREPYEEFDEGVKKLKDRLGQAVGFVQLTAASQQYCRCVYVNDPSCIVCTANRILSQWQSEDGASETMP